MFPLQSWMLQHFKEVRSLCESCSLPVNTLETLERDVQDFRVRVPLIGPFSAGKSSLINALLEEKLLGVEVDPETALPTEIRYSSEEAFYLYMKDQTRRPVSRDLLKAREFSAFGQNPSHLSALLASDKLSAWPHLCLVDMPGWDSGIEAHSAVIDNYLSRSLAYVLVLPVSDGTLQASLHSLLSELNLHAMPVFVLISKADQKTPEDGGAVLEKIRHEMAGIMKKSPFTTDLISSRKKNIAAFIKSLDSLEQQAESLFAKSCGARMVQELGMIQSHIAILLNEENLDAEAITLRQEHLKAEMKAFEEKMNREYDRLKEQIPPCCERILSMVEAELSGSLENLTTAALHGGDMEALVGQRVRSACTRGIQSEFEPRMQKYFHTLEGLLPEDLTRSFHVSLEGLEAQGTEGMGSIKTGLRTTLTTLLLAMKANPLLALITPLLFGIFDLFMGKAEKRIAEEKRREEARQQVLHTLIPGVLSRLSPLLVRGMEKQVETVQEDIRGSITRHRESMEQALQTLAGELKQSQAEFEARRAARIRDRERLQALIAHLGGSMA